MYKLILSLAFVLSFAPLAKTQDTSPVYEHMKDMEWMIGEWIGTSHVPSGTDSSDELGELEGKNVTQHRSIRWAPGKSALVEEFEYVIEGTATISGTSLTGWDQHANAIRSTEYTTHKGVWSGTWTKDGDRWIHEYEGFNLDGRKGTGRLVITGVSSRRFEAKEVDRATDGKPQPGMQWVFERANNYP